jgi:hypothetical protein
MKNIPESNWSPPFSERQVPRAERRKNPKGVKFWNPIRAWRSAKQAWWDSRSKIKENDDGGKAVVTGRTIFIEEERRSFLKKLRVAAAVAAVVSPTALVLSETGAQASQLANYVQFVGSGNGSTNDSTAFQNTLNAVAAQPNGGAVFVPPCSVSYIVDNISLPSEVSIIGGDLRAVQFKALSGSTNNMFVMPAGHVINCRYENFTCNANGNANQNCFMLQAVQVGADGGMWYSIFKNILVNGFSGYGFWFRGGTNGFLAPHQFITFDSVTVIRANNKYSRSVLLTGQSGQFKFQGICDLDGAGVPNSGYNIELGPEFFNSGAPAGQQSGGQLVGGSAIGSNTPYNIIFHGITSQTALTAIYTCNTINVIVDSCYEGVAQVIVGNSVTYNLAVINCHFTNCGQLSGAGFILRMANGSSGSIVGCDSLTKPDRFISNGSGNGGGQVYSRYNNMANGTANLDANMTQSVGGPTAAVKFQFQVYINNSTAITSITSQHTVGDRVSFVNQQGGLSASFTAGNNIKLGRWSTLTLGNLDTAFFELSDIAGGWQLLGTTGTLS